MESYILAVIVMIILTSAVLASVLYKNKLFNFRIFAAIIISSIIVCIMFPLIFNVITGICGSSSDGMGILLAFILTLLIYILLVFFMSIAVMSFSKTTVKTGVDYKTGILQNLKKKFQRVGEKENFVDSVRNIDKMGLDNLPAGNEIVTDESTGASENGEAKDLKDNSPDASIEALPVFSETAAIAWPNSEDVVNTKTPAEETAVGIGSCDDCVPEEAVTAGLDLTGQEINMSLEDYINEAFRLKSAGDLEGAIIYYMYALDSNPDRDLVFMLVLDICTLYKSLGQVELAKEILESYYSRYGDLMDHTVRTEIERNLQGI